MVKMNDLMAGERRSIAAQLLAAIMHEKINVSLSENDHGLALRFATRLVGRHLGVTTADRLKT
jgi:hypothetical protein